jgi:hypothetical protein
MVVHLLYILIVHVRGVVGVDHAAIPDVVHKPRNGSPPSELLQLS